MMKLICHGFPKPEISILSITYRKRDSKTCSWGTQTKGTLTHHTGPKAMGLLGWNLRYVDTGNKEISGLVDPKGGRACMPWRSDSTPTIPAWKDNRNNRKRVTTWILQHQSKTTARQYTASLGSSCSPNMAAFTPPPPTCHP